jgi:hypothetical protein
MAANFSSTLRRGPRLHCLLGLLPARHAGAAPARAGVGADANASLIGASEIEVIDLLGQGQFGDGQLVFDRARLFLRNLGGKEITDNALRLVPTLDVGVITSS